MKFLICEQFLLFLLIFRWVAFTPDGVNLPMKFLTGSTFVFPLIFRWVKVKSLFGCARVAPLVMTNQVITLGSRLLSNSSVLCCAFSHTHTYQVEYNVPLRSNCPLVAELNLNHVDDEPPGTGEVVKIHASATSNFT